MIKGFKDSYIYVEGIGITKTSLAIENGKITSIGEQVDGVQLDEGKILIPGFIDQHIHGGNHSDGMYPTYEDILNISNTVASEGVTAYLATTMTQSIENIEKALENIHQYMEKKESQGAEVVGIHLEGPFINKKFKGAQPEEFIIPCDVETFKHFQEKSGKHIKLVTLAYEENGEKLVKYLKKHNIVASLGHTDATAKQVLEAAKKGATCLTHSFNAMKPLHHREAGTIGGAMLAKNMYCELICDLVHVSKEAIQILYKMKGKNRMILVTDGMEAKHLHDGVYQLGGQEVTVTGKEARLASGTLAGSTLYMNEALRNIISVMGISMEEAIDLATKNPAKLLKIYDRKGSIQVGKDADFVVVDKNLEIYQTIRGGKVVYTRS